MTREVVASEVVTSGAVTSGAAVSTRSRSRLRRLAGATAAVLLLTGVAACAGVPATSPVQVVRQVGAGDSVAPPPAPVAGANSLDIVRGFVTASASSADRHGAARRFLTQEAGQDWNDGAALTVLEGQIDTVPVITGAQAPGTATVRIRGTKVGRLVPQTGAFEADVGQYSSDLQLVQRDGQWRISRLPAGVVVGLDEFRSNYKAVPVWFVDPARRRVVSDLRYLPVVPSRTQPARVVDMLLAGPSAALSGAAASLLAGAELRANVATGADGAVVVDLTRITPPDDAARRLIAAQIVLSLAEVNVMRVRILIDGEPLLAGRSEWTREDVAGLVGEARPAPGSPAIVVSGGRVGTLSGPVPAAPIPGPAGNGGVAAVSAAVSADGRRLAVVARAGNGNQLMVGRMTDGVLNTVEVTAGILTRPTWTPDADEVWTVADGRRIVRVPTAPDGPAEPATVDAGALTAMGSVTDLRLSRDGVRVLAVVDGGLYVGAVARGLDGRVAITEVRKLRPQSLEPVVSADWRSTELVVAITRNPDLLVAQVGVDGLALSEVISTNLTAPLTALAAGPDRPFLVTDQTGVWTRELGAQDAWRQQLSGAAGAVPGYPG
ncbi:Sporulation and spore germination [Pseudonocardia thermophila]|uniref:Sporulation and spore germination n=1 Tax=Pseudonocardia thermophila TaxID=1848 RepID=A0A1M6TKZ3_PSETH|nr:Sporulation and spore germination [Pseudonocardia thermophila]